MSKCGICGKARRVGSGGRALLLDSAGQLRTATACAACLERSIRLVALPPPTTTTIESDDSDVKKVLRGLAKYIRMVAKLEYGQSTVILRGEGFDVDVIEKLSELAVLKRDGLEQAADFADAWADERAARKSDATNDAPIVMRGWVCKTCKSWNGDEKERRETCRVCAGPRAVENNVSHVVAQCACESKTAGRCDLREGHDGKHQANGFQFESPDAEPALLAERTNWTCDRAAPFDSHLYCTRPEGHDGTHSWEQKMHGRR